MEAGKLIAFIIALLLMLPVAGRSNTTVQDVIAKIMHAYGGHDAVEKIRTVCAKGWIVASAFNAEGTYSYCVAKDRRLRVDIEYTSFAEHRVLNGRNASVQQGDGSTRILTEGPEYLSIIYQYEQLSLPWALLAPAGRVHYEGRELRGDQPVDVLSLQAAATSLIKIYVDAASGRIIKTSGSFRMGGSQMELFSDFYDFRQVGNTIFPFKLVNYAGGDKIAETSIQDYELNPSLAGKTFQIGGAPAE
jgi:hypothetical protein